MHLIYAIILLIIHSSHGDYITKRQKIINDEFQLSLGGNMTLSDKETLVNNCLMQHKYRELDYAFNNQCYFNFSKHFFTYKDNIRKSEVYKILRNMPKGAALHVHDMGILGPDYIMNITYMDHLYVCFDGNDLRMRFANDSPSIPCSGEWNLMSKVRRASSNIAKFDAELRRHFTLVVDDPDKTYPCINEVWRVFINYFITVSSILAYRPIWEQYFYDALKRFREENIMYVEVRSILPNLYELDGTTYDSIITARTYKKVIRRFVKDYPDFSGAKLIYAPSRLVNKSTVEQYLALAKKIKANMPGEFAGFDLVGQEDLGSPLIDFAQELSDAGKDLNYFFHAGETDWYGMATDDNLIDAVLLGAKRIGHGYALEKHPLLMKEVIENDIGVEVNVISNAVLSLVRDIRNHPLSDFFAKGLPVVLSSDDPGVWGADVISDDFYVAFMGIASKSADLRLLKTLGLNSLKYSALDGLAKNQVIKKFNERWNGFINKFNCNSH